MTPLADVLFIQMLGWKTHWRNKNLDLTGNLKGVWFVTMSDEADPIARGEWDTLDCNASSALGRRKHRIDKQTEYPVKEQTPTGHRGRYFTFQGNFQGQTVCTWWSTAWYYFKLKLCSNDSIRVPSVTMKKTNVVTEYLKYPQIKALFNFLHKNKEKK